MPITRKILQVLREDPTASDLELAAKVFGVSVVESGQLSVPEANMVAVQEALSRLTELAPNPTSNRPRTGPRKV